MVTYLFSVIDFFKDYEAERDRTQYKYMSMYTHIYVSLKTRIM